MMLNFITKNTVVIFEMKYAKLTKLCVPSAFFVCFVVKIIIIFAVKSSNYAR